MRDAFRRPSEERWGSKPFVSSAGVYLAATLAASVAATVAVAPIIGLYFGKVPVWSIPATLFALPVLPLSFVLAALTGFAGMLLEPVGTVIGWPLWVVAEYMAGVSRVFANIPPGPLDAVGWAAPAAAAYYGGLAVFLARSRISRAARSAWLIVTGLPRRQIPWAPPLPLALIAVALAGVCLALVATAQPTRYLRLTFFEVDRGHMALIETPGGSTVLIDGGLDPEGAVERLESYKPFWDRSLDLVVLTHPDADHVGGLQAVIERFGVDALMESPVEHDSFAYAAWRKLADAHPRRFVADAGQVVAFDNGVALQVLMARRDEPGLALNDASIVTMLTYGKVSVLLPGDISRESEARLVETGAELRSTALLVPHHGSDTSSSEVFLDAASPAIAIVQVGNRNPYGHPSPDVMERLSSVVPQGQTLVTSEQGTVTLESDGERLWVRTGG